VLHLQHIQQTACFMFLWKSLIDGPQHFRPDPFGQNTRSKCWREAGMMFGSSCETTMGPFIGVRHGRYKRVLGNRGGQTRGWPQSAKRAIVEGQKVLTR
jgi:hypothetical protein